MPPTDKPRIACVGWGSLVWQPRTLPCIGAWRADGPELPVEFARESGVPGKGSRGDRITLVICPGVPRVCTYWAFLDADDIAAARTLLALREYERAKPAWTQANIGFWNAASNQSHGLEADTIAQWARSMELAGVVWTNLSCGFVESRGVMPSEDDVLVFLRSLADRAKAEEYVRRAPAQVQTRYRQAIERELGWTA